ncbi:MAG: polyprenyl synthetase family protein [Nitrospinota bacterium]|nr:polyprenyl synthetase family protein [Nitrospinota bacterium]
MEFSEVIALHKDGLLKVEEEIKRNYNSDIQLIPQISGYLMNGGGKRLRPLLVLLSAHLCGGSSDARTARHGCAVEYIHAATLLHDDVIDETTIRRGNETVNSKWSSDASILVGDYLISQSVILIAYDSNPRTIQAIADAAKILVEGGILEFSKARELDITEEYYLDVIYRKTASILSVSCQIGAILAEADEASEEALISFGNKLGIAFQLVDDVMDYDSTEELLGKPLGTDFREGHVTLPLFYLYKNADATLQKEIEGFVKNEHITHREFDYILDRMREAKAFEYTLDKARDYIEGAKAELRGKNFKSPEHIEAFLAVADYLIDRHTTGNQALYRA